MKHTISLLSLLLMVGLFIGCSDDDNPTGGGEVPNSVTVWLSAEGYYSTSLDATNEDQATFYAFGDNIVTPKIVPGQSAVTNWDIGFRREEIMTNGGSSANGGDAVAASLGAVDFDSVTADDTTGLEWESDFIEEFIDEWYIYTGPPTHQLLPTRFVYSMVDASGEHYVKFQIDSMVGGGMPPDMGTVYMKYFYQTTADSKDLSGNGVEVVIPVGATPTYFDFSSGAVVTPTIPANDLGWDIYLYNYDLYQNSGPSGVGACAAFPAFSELADSTDFDGFTAQPTGAPMFPDIAGSAMTEWYTYTGPPSHQLFSNSDVYIIRSNGVYYKLRIESYYGENGDKASANYHFIWAVL